MNCVHIHLTLQIMQIVPPFPQEIIGNQSEPRCELDIIGLRICNKFLQLLLRHVLRIADFVGVWIELYILLKEQNVVDYVSICIGK